MPGPETAMQETPKDIDLLNPEFLQAWNLLRNTRRSVFLTGKAGSGKSTFLRYICEHTPKKYVVLAPTGIAAMNVGGQTMHSFFQMPMRPVPCDDPDYSLLKIGKKVKYKKEKIKIMKELELVIIDEISMVRADMIDFIDRALRNVRRNREPFGGCQLLLVGDIFQLEPVITPETRNILSYSYKDFFFFNARVYEHMELVAVELRKIYRQKSVEFVEMLDRFRENRATTEDFRRINSRYTPKAEAAAGSGSDGKFVMTLAARRETVDGINDREMDRLPGEERVYSGTVHDEFPDKLLPTDKELRLKVGAQVLLIKNDPDRRWVNGTLAKIHALTDDSIRIELEDGSFHALDKIVWENMKYVYNEETKRIDEQVIGTFTQFPVKPAWAMTIHKSQGLTFDNVVIDMEGGAFSGGQTYVALSRCTSLEGIRLCHPISPRDVRVNPEVVRFSGCFNSRRAVDSALNDARADYLFVQAKQAADSGDYAAAIEDFYKGLTFRNELGRPEIRRYIAMLMGRINRLQRRIGELEKERRQLAREFVDMGGECLASGDELWEPALANFRKAIRFDDRNADALLGASRASVLGGQAEQGVDYAKRALKLQPRNWEINIAIAEAERAAGDCANALIQYGAALKRRDRDPRIYDAIADLLDEMGFEDEAQENREKAAKLRKRKKK